MKYLVTACAAVLLSACATTSQPESADRRVIEMDLMPSKGDTTLPEQSEKTDAGKAVDLTSNLDFGQFQKPGSYETGKQQPKSKASATVHYTNDVLGENGLFAIDEMTQYVKETYPGGQVNYVVHLPSSPKSERYYKEAIAALMVADVDQSRISKDFSMSSLAANEVVITVK